jgi:hypothetical protein
MDFKEGKRDSIEITDTEVCEYCKKHLLDDSIKTIVYHNDKSSIIKFCSYKCFEQKEDWDKYKVKNRRKSPVEKKIDADKKWLKENPIQKGIKDVLDKNVSEKEIIESLEKRWKSITSHKLNKVVLPKLSKKELRDFASENGIRIPKVLTNKEQIVEYVLEELQKEDEKTEMSTKEKWIQEKLKEIQNINKENKKKYKKKDKTGK